MANPWQQDPNSAKHDDSPSWMHQGNENSRLDFDPSALASVWLEATDEDSFGGNNGKQQAVAGAATKQIVQGSSTHPGQPEKCFGKSMDLCVGTTIFFLEFVFVVLFEFLHSYCGWSAWFCKDQLDKLTKNDPNQSESSACNMFCKYVCIIFLAVGFMVFIIISFAMLICQVGIVELCAAFAFMFRGLAALNGDHAMWAWGRTREVTKTRSGLAGQLFGHRIRDALGKKCRKQATSDIEQQYPNKQQPVPGQGLAPPGGPQGQASFFGGSAAVPAPTPYAAGAGASPAEAPPSWASQTPVAQPVAPQQPAPPPPPAPAPPPSAATPATTEETPSWVNG